MKGKILLLLFALPFFGVGVWMTYSVGSNLNEAWQMRQWEAVQASLQNAGTESKSGEDSTTYEAHAEYDYVFAGSRYSADRVSISGGADNIGEYQRDMGNRLRQAMAQGETITVYVDPAAPGSAVIDRSIRWGLIGFKSIFLFVFGGFGLGLIIFTLRAPKERELTAAEFVSEPWLANDSWQTAEVRSSSRATMITTWCFAGIWNLISAPLPFLIYSEVTEKNNLPALFGLLFPVVGAGLLVWAVRRTREWNRFGPTPVQLDPFPGSIGGHVGGEIDIKIPHDSNYQFSMTLTNIYSYESGSGENRSRRERAEWQETQVAHSEFGSAGTRLRFRFDVPPQLSESTADQSEKSYHLWRLNLKASLPGVDLDRDYEIPVYATARQSRLLPDVSVEQGKLAQQKIDTDEIAKQFEFSHEAGGKSILFPMGRNMSVGLGGFVFGSIFFGIGWFLITHDNSLLFGGVFGLVGSLIAIVSLYFVFNSLEIVSRNGEIHTIRRVLGFIVKRQSMRVSDFVRFSKRSTMQSQSGGKHVVYYTINAIDRNDQSMVVGEGFKGMNQANAAAEFIAQKFSLIIKPQSALGANSAVDELNLLTAD